MYIKSARFQLENWDAQAWLDSQSSQLGSAQLSSGNFSSNSSLVGTIYKREISYIYKIDFQIRMMVKAKKKQ